MLSAAANDPSFRQAPSRTLPVRASMRRISGYPRTLCLYRIPASRFWQVRLFHEGRLICRSTREEQFEAAIGFARWFFDTIIRDGRLPAETPFGQGQPLVPDASGVQGEEKPGRSLAFRAPKADPASESPQVFAEPGASPRAGHLVDAALFCWVAERFMLREAARRDRGEFAELSFRADRIRLDGRILPFFGQEAIRSIDARRLEDFLLMLEAQKLSSTSLSLYLMTLRKIMRYALSQGLIAAMPIFPKVRIRKTSRGSFTPTEYVRILRKARSRVGTVIHDPAGLGRLRGLVFPSAVGRRPAGWSDPDRPPVRAEDASGDRCTQHDAAPHGDNTHWTGFHFDYDAAADATADAKPRAQRRFWILPKYWETPPDLPWVIAFMVNSFIRPSDLKTLRHRHVEVVRAEYHYLRLTLPETKAHDKPIVTLRPAVRVYQTLQRHWAARNLAGPDDFLFLPQESNRNYALAVLGWMFRHLLDDLGLRLGPHGNPRTLYSLRHTAITFRLLYGQGIDVLTLARNARTSVEMIEKHYASTLTGERNIGMLQSRRTARRT